MAPTPSEQDVGDLELLRTHAVNAGLIAAGFFRRGVKSWTKENASPVTEADIAVDDFLHASLLASRPDYGWLSEEHTDSAARLKKSRLFIVDPIDGTRAFMRGEDAWTICLSVVENGRPVAGVVYAPARDELYEAVLNGGAFLNKSPLPLASPQRENVLVPAAQAVRDALRERGVNIAQGQHFPSLAYRLMQVATGDFDGVVARRGAHDWDISAADLILSEAGLILNDVCSPGLTYNLPDTRHAALAVLRDERLKAQFHDALRAVYGCPEPATSAPQEPSRNEQGAKRP